MAKKTRYRPESFETATSGDHFTRLYDSMLLSDAYKDLTHSARTLYTLLKMKYRGAFTGDTVTLPYKVLRQYGMNTTTIHNAIADLERHGFLKVSYGTKMTSATGLRKQRNEYKFIEDWKSWKADD